jgi:AcrR family transcriptional regulator
MRADARRNRERIMAAAREVFERDGAAAALEEIARRAGVGIATLYRHFPDRAALVRAVALELTVRVAAEAEAALAEEPDAASALARYLHRALDAGIAALLPALLDDLPLSDPEFRRAQDAGAGPVRRMLEQAQAAGDVRPDLAFGDLGLLLIRLGRPLPAPIPPELNRLVAHRQLDLALAGMRAIGAAPLSGPGLALADLRRLQPSGAPHTHSSGPDQA